MHELIGLLQAAARSVWRQRWLVLLAAWIVSVAGWTYVTQIPDQYEAEARVHVDTQSILRPLLEGLAVEPDINQQVPHGADVVDTPHPGAGGPGDGHAPASG